MDALNKGKNSYILTAIHNITKFITLKNVCRYVKERIHFASLALFPVVGNTSRMCSHKQGSKNVIQDKVLKPYGRTVESTNPETQSLGHYNVNFVPKGQKIIVSDHYEIL